MENTTNGYTTPVDCIKEHILKRFSNTNPEFYDYIDSLIRKGVIKQNIIYCLENEKIKSPFVDSDGYIHIQSTFLCYMWINSYYSLVMYEELAVKYFENLQQDKNHLINHALISQTIDFQQYAMSLFKSYSDWDLTIYPSPKTPDTSGKNYCDLATELTIYGMDYVLCHEFAHLELDHFHSTKNSIEKEKEADNRAFELILAGRNGSNNVSLEMGILMGLCGLIFAKPKIGSSTHPDIIERIKSFLELINPNDNSFHWCYVCMIIGVWDNKFSKNLDFLDNENYKKMFYELCDDIYQKEK